MVDIKITKREEDTILGTLNFELFRLKVDLNLLQERETPIKSRIEEIKIELDEKMESLDIEKFSNEAGTISRRVDIFPKIEDFDEFVQYIAETTHYELLKRSVNSKPFREIISRGDTVPGLDSFEKSTINTRIAPTFRDAILAKSR